MHMQLSVHMNVAIIQWRVTQTQSPSPQELSREKCVVVDSPMCSMQEHESCIGSKINSPNMDLCLDPIMGHNIPYFQDSLCLPFTASPIIPSHNCHLLLVLLIRFCLSDWHHLLLCFFLIVLFTLSHPISLLAFAFLDTDKVCLPLIFTYVTKFMHYTTLPQALDLSHYIYFTRVSSTTGA